MKEMSFDVNSYSTGLYSDIKCPYCGKSHFRVGGSITTAMYCPTIIKDGKVVSVDGNTSTTEFYCLECEKTFKQVSKNGESVIEKVEPQPIASLSISDNDPPYNITIDSDGIVSGTENLEIIPNLNLDRYRKCNICDKTFVCGPCMQSGIGPDTDKYICDECANRLKKLLYGEEK